MAAERRNVPPPSTDKVPVELLRPLARVTVSDPLQRIFACTLDKHVHIYHADSYQSLQVLTDDTLYRPRDELAHLMVVSEPTLKPPLHRMYTAGNKLSLVSACVTRAACVHSMHVFKTYCGMCMFIAARHFLINPGMMLYSVPYSALSF